MGVIKCCSVSRDTKSSQFHTLSLLKLSPNHQARAVLVAVWMYLSLREEIAFDNSVN